ncbi:hypothetical protein AB0J03_32610 [Streptomyces microflavus]|uniref:hypothetical protein n=1 Tax=Streptomyces microflavus TaxID=1919 RepID=UPI0033F4C3DC
MTDLVALAGAIEDVDALGKQLNAVLIGTVMALMLTGSVVLTWKATKSILAAGATFVGGAALWFLVMNAALFRDSVGENLKPSSAPTSVVKVAETGSGDELRRVGGGR